MITHARSTMRRRVSSALTEHLPLKLAAVFFALVLWLVVSAEEPTEEVVSVRFEPALDSGVVLDGGAPAVRALVLGRGRELLKLYNAVPVIHRRVRSGLRDSVRVELGPADVDLPAGVSAVVRDVRPRIVTLRMHRTLPLSESDTAHDIERDPRDSADNARADTAARDTLADSAAGVDVRRIDGPAATVPATRVPNVSPVPARDSVRRPRP
jgi:hypothetical protein